MRFATALVIAALVAPIQQFHPKGPVAAKVCGPDDWPAHARPPRESLSAPLWFGSVDSHALGCPYTLTPPPMVRNPADR